MKKLILLSTFFFSISTNALPNCPLDQSLRYDNCYGAYTDSDGDKYVGAWKDNKMNGQGTYTWADGKKQRGYYVNGEYVPDICEDMGLSKGTSGYEQCVLKLIDKL